MGVVLHRAVRARALLIISKLKHYGTALQGKNRFEVAKINRALPMILTKSLLQPGDFDL